MATITTRSPDGFDVMFSRYPHKTLGPYKVARRLALTWLANFVFYLILILPLGITRNRLLLFLAFMTVVNLLALPIMIRSHSRRVRPGQPSLQPEHREHSSNGKSET